MHDTYTSRNAEDFRQRYIGCFGWFIPESKKEIPVYLDRIKENTLFFTGLDGVPYHTYVDSGVQFKFASMRKAIYSGLDGKVYYLQRQPARQWRRGICQGNTSMYLLTDSGAMDVAIDLESMSNILNCEVKNSNVLSEQFAVVAESVYLYNIVIGYCRLGTIKLKKGYEMFTQDILDAVRDSKLNFKVE